jgi:cytochrome c oxidase subunit 1
MPRRVYTYVPETGWDNLNLLATVGATVLFVSVAIGLLNVVTSMRKQPDALDNPWNGDTLEWATSSPPPHYNFAALPVVESRDAMWRRSDPMPVVTGVPDDKHEVLVTTILDATPSHRESVPGASIWPFAMSVAVGAGMWALVYSAYVWWPTCAAVAIIGPLWYWANSATEKSGQGGF